MKRVLIVDDEEDVRLFLRDFLDERDFAVDTAEDGESAVSMMQKAPYDVVLLDVMMPGMDGMECLKKLKAISKISEVIMITALKDQSKMEQAKSQGARAYIVKPFSLNYLESELVKIIE